MLLATPEPLTAFILPVGIDDIKTAAARPEMTSHVGQ
jgi:hypothetical protein